MRIAQVVESLEVGGLERMALNLAKEQKAAGHEVFIYCVVGGGPLLKEAEAAGIVVRQFAKAPGLAADLWPRLAWRFLRDGIEVAHAHNPGIHIYVAPSARLAGVPVVINTRHGAVTSFGRPYQERHFRMSLPFTDHVVFVSEQAREVCMGQCGLAEKRGSVIVNGIPVRRYSERPATPGSARPRIRFGTVGRMVPAKGHAVLIDAFARVAERIPEAELSIAGGGPLWEQMKEQVRRLALCARVSLEGPTEDVPGFFRELDVFVFSSLSEGLPLVILEAMAAGLPIVSTRVGGVPDVAPEGEVAWYCPTGDAQALAEAMCTAARSAELAERGRRAMELAEARYDVSAMAREYERVYEECRR